MNMEQLKVLVLFPASKEHKKMLESKAVMAEFTYSNSSAVTEEQVQQADVILGNPPVGMLRQSGKLKWLQLNNAGYDNYLGDGILASDTILTNASGAYGLAISEYMICGLLMLYKKMPFYFDEQKQARWSDGGVVKSIYGATVLVIGFGDIGNEFARRAKAMGARIIGIRRRRDQKPDYVDELHTMDRLEALLPQADVVSLSIPASPETYHLMDEKRLALMKQDAVLLNVGRGSSVDSDALCRALNSGKLGGAYLDVTEPEPLPGDHPLWNANNIIITPHITGGFHLPETLKRIVSICAENLEAFVAGAAMKNVVRR